MSGSSSVLSLRTAGTSPIDSSAVNQYFYALTGVQTGQPYTLANTLTVTNTLTGSSNIAVSGTAAITGATTVTGAVSASTVTSCQLVTARAGHNSSQVVGILFGSSGPSILYGSSIPTASALPGSLFMNQGGSSTQVLYVAMPNGGGASSSNWSPFTFP